MSVGADTVVMDCSVDKTRNAFLDIEAEDSDPDEDSARELGAEDADALNDSFIVADGEEDAEEEPFGTQLMTLEHDGGDELDEMLARYATEESEAAAEYQRQKERRERRQRQRKELERGDDLDDASSVDTEVTEQGENSNSAEDSGFMFGGRFACPPRCST